MSPFVSIIVPVRNEEKFIARCLESILQQDYAPWAFEVVVVDGASTDRTREIIQAFKQRYHNLRYLDNPQRIVPISLNLGLQQARGEIIIRVDGHAAIMPDYITQCVKALANTQADCVGGAIKSINETKTARAIAIAMSSSFGVGNSRFRLAGYEGYVDTLAFGAYRRNVFEKIGVFDEELVRCQDDEFNYRLRKNKGKIYLSAKIQSCYFPRTDLKKLWRQYFQYGLWKIRVLQKHPAVMQPRQFVPPLFVLGLLLLMILSIWVPLIRLGLAGILSLYTMATFTFTIRLWLRSKDSSFPALLASFPILHISYGLGFWAGLIKFRKRWGEPEAFPTISLSQRQAAEHSALS
ncbi:MAG: hypothetical protein ALAOOOJD_03955 [bacterium]|nr:hypothetical protein [bacterium]